MDLASAITALARIHMHELMKKVTVYYTDTDSIVIEEKDLHKLEDYIGPKLGQLKIVNHWDEAIFIAPKVYVAFSENNYHFVAKSIKKESLDVKDFFIILKDRLKKDSEQNFQIIIPSQMTKSLRDQRIYQYYDLQKNYYFKYDKRKKVYKDDLWVDTLPLNIYRNYII